MPDPKPEPDKEARPSKSRSGQWRVEPASDGRGAPFEREVRELLERERPRLDAQP